MSTPIPGSSNHKSNQTNLIKLNDKGEILIGNQIYNLKIEFLNGPTRYASAYPSFMEINRLAVDIFNSMLLEGAPDTTKISIEYHEDESKKPLIEKCTILSKDDPSIKRDLSSEELNPNQNNLTTLIEKINDTVVKLPLLPTVRNDSSSLANEDSSKKTNLEDQSTSSTHKLIRKKEEVSFSSSNEDPSVDDITLLKLDNSNSRQSYKTAKSNSKKNAQSSALNNLINFNKVPSTINTSTASKHKRSSEGTSSIKQ